MTTCTPVSSTTLRRRVVSQQRSTGGQHLERSAGAVGPSLAEPGEFRGVERNGADAEQVSTESGEQLLASATATRSATKADQGCKIISPTKKLPGELSEDRKANNKVINRLRATIERDIANIKTWRILHIDYRVFAGQSRLVRVVAVFDHLFEDARVAGWLVG